MTTMTQTDIDELQKYRDISASYTENGTADELQDFIENLEGEADEDNLYEKLYYSDNFEEWVRGSDLYSELESEKQELECELETLKAETELRLSWEVVVEELKAEVERRGERLWIEESPAYEELERIYETDVESLKAKNKELKASVVVWMKNCPALGDLESEVETLKSENEELKAKFERVCSALRG